MKFARHLSRMFSISCGVYPCMATYATCMRFADSECICLVCVHIVKFNLCVTYIDLQAGTVCV